MIKDADAIAAAQELYRAMCERLRKRPVETVGEIAFAEGLKLAVLFDANGKMAAAFKVTADRVIDLDGQELVKLRTKLSNRKVR
jgi:hypothetical protein